jgi:hypothetical protein
VSPMARRQSNVTSADLPAQGLEHTLSTIKQIHGFCTGLTSAHRDARSQVGPRIAYYPDLHAADCDGPALLDCVRELVRPRVRVLSPAFEENPGDFRPIHVFAPLSIGGLSSQRIQSYAGTGPSGGIAEA